MSKRTIFLSGGIVAILALVGVVLASQILLNQPADLRSPLVGAQPKGIDPASRASGVSPQTAPTQGTNTISVSGVGRATAAPDIARLSIGAEAVGPNAGRVVSDVNTRQANIIAKLKGLGISEKDIQTSSFNVSIDRGAQPRPGVEGPLNYRAVNSAQVIVRKPEQLAAVIDAAVEAGANNIYGVSLGLADNTAVMGEARAKAVADAKAKAEALAKAAGVKLGRIVSITEGGGVTPVPGFAEARSASAFETGELTITAQVVVVFAIEP